MECTMAMVSDITKIKVGSAVTPYSISVTLMGTLVEDKVNFMTVT